MKKKLIMFNKTISNSYANHSGLLWLKYCKGYRREKMYALMQKEE